MSFIWPVMLITLVLVPLLIIVYNQLVRRRRSRVAEFGSLGLAPRANASSHLPAIFFVAGLVVLLVGLARPQAEVELPAIEGTLILAFDVSGSMAADDLQPSRMEAAKAVARDFVQRQPSTIKIAIVAFSNSGFMLQAPTNDQAKILAAINRLGPQQGTSLGQGILSALKVIDDSKPGQVHTDIEGRPIPTATPSPMPRGQYAPAAMILLTDGENLEGPDPLESAQAAADRGLRIYPIGLGSPEGVILKVNGYTVHTSLNEEILKEIAQITGGEYRNAQDEQELQTVYNNIGLKFVVKPQEMEITAIFAGASLLILLIGGILFYGGRR